MKVNFHARYQEISKAIQPEKAKPQAGVEDFSKLIGSLDGSTNPPETAPKIQEMLLPPQDEVLHDMRARLNFPAPELIPPKPEPLELPAAPEPKVNSVKTPALIGAERVVAPPATLSVDEIGNLVSKYAPSLGVDPALTMAIAEAESSFAPGAVSKDGFSSKGLFQLLDSTAETVIEREGLSTSFDPFNPEQNTKVGTHYLRYLHDLFSSETKLPNGDSTQPAANSSSLEKLAVAAFNAGEGRVASAQARVERAGGDPSQYEQVREYLPEITKKYVDRVMRMRGSYEERFIG